MAGLEDYLFVNTADWKQSYVRKRSNCEACDYQVLETVLFLVALDADRKTSENRLRRILSEGLYSIVRYREMIRYKMPTATTRNILHLEYALYYLLFPKKFQHEQS